MSKPTSIPIPEVLINHDQKSVVLKLNHLISREVIYHAVCEWPKLGVWVVEMVDVHTGRHHRAAPRKNMQYTLSIEFCGRMHKAHVYSLIKLSKNSNEPDAVVDYNLELEPAA